MSNLIEETKPVETDTNKPKLTEVSDTEELKIQHPATKIPDTKATSEIYKLMPEEFAEVQNKLQAVQAENRQITVYADSIENRIGYDSLLRVLAKNFGRQVAYLRSEQGGSLSLEEAREQVYRQNINEAEATALLNDLLGSPIDSISFADLLELHGDSPATAENLWEMIKREAQNEFESGHRAAEVFEPTDSMMDAWNRASYLGLRESLCEEWQPQGGIELSMIDFITQAWLLLQLWTKECVLRSKTEPRRENEQFLRWKGFNPEAESRQWDNGDWDIPTVTEQAAVEHAAQMADRCQRMYFRAIRSLRDWRRYAQPVTINNPQQVNIAAEGGQQINVANNEKS
ncbi:MAG TPA: hypothetical protein VNI84_00930 [Pyrinomonadaceae bacterium]|nr:hypothetical protein [Pyrinomonadaceae bacterium]